MTNQELAARALALADDLADDRAARKIALTAHVALSTTKTPASARKVLAEWDGPAVVRDGAVTLLDQLEGR